MALNPIQDARQLVAEMTPAEQVGQMFMVGFAGTVAPAWLLDRVAQGNLGGVIYFSRNVAGPRQTAELSASLQHGAAATRLGIPLAIGIDQEGGTVVRLPADGGFTHFPSQMAMGATRSAALVRQVAAAMAREMRAVGINFNLAPVLDVNHNPDNPVIGVRSFGADPMLVAELGVAAISGYREGGVAACGKHFPGHGDTTVDSHLALPVIPHSRRRLDAVELGPFRAALRAGVDALMTAHVFFPQIEPEAGLPATLSPRVMQGLLRQELGFDGVLCTDCLEMRGVAGGFAPDELALRAVAAGADLLLVSHSPDVQQVMLETLLHAVRTGRISIERVAASAFRILRMKQHRQMGVAPAPALAPELAGIAAHRALAITAARQAVTLAWDRGVLPLQPGRRVVAVLPRSGRLTQAEDSRTVLEPVQAVLARELGAVELIACPPDLQGFSAADLAGRLGAGATVLFGAVRSGAYPAQIEAVRTLRAAGCAVVMLGLRLPQDLEYFQGLADAAVDLYDDSPAMLQAGVEVLLGRRAPAGQWPVPVAFQLGGNQPPETGDFLCSSGGAGSKQ